MTNISHHFAGTDGEVLVVQAPGELTHDSGEHLRRLVARHLPNRDRSACVLDMTHVGLISSIGITALLQIQEFCTDRSAPILLAGLPDRQRQFLRMLKLEQRFAFSPGVDDAIIELGRA